MRLTTVTVNAWVGDVAQVGAVRASIGRTTMVASATECCAGGVGG